MKTETIIVGTEYTIRYDEGARDDALQLVLKGWGGGTGLGPNGAYSASPTKREPFVVEGDA